MGCKNLFSGTLGKLFIEEEITIGVAALSIAGLSFESIGSDHRSDEDIISVFRESVWDFSGVPVPSGPSLNVGWYSGSFELNILFFLWCIIRFIFSIIRF